jgi:hypothetical protein
VLVLLRLVELWSEFLFLSLFSGKSTRNRKESGEKIALDLMRFGVPNTTATASTHTPLENK